MTQEQRPKVYLALCLLALLVEVVFIIAKAPPVCARCKHTLEMPSRELPEFCVPCVETIRAILLERGGGAPQQAQPARERLSSYTPPYPVDPRDPLVTLETSRGDVVVELFPKRAPISTENFLHYVRERRYDGVIFHRLEDYLCVSGRFRGGYAGEPLSIIPQFPPIKSESSNGVQNRRGTISLPRQDASADSATSDFFFNLKENPFYDRRGDAPNEAGYAVFGQVVKGYELLDDLRFMATRDIGSGNEKAPRDAVTIRRAFEIAPNVLGTVATLGSRTQTGR